jgi:hypothetical protein
MDQPALGYHRAAHVKNKKERESTRHVTHVRAPVAGVGGTTDRTYVRNGEDQLGDLI